jgi:hypothetical protein
MARRSTTASSADADATGGGSGACGARLRRLSGCEARSDVGAAWAVSERTAGGAGGTERTRTARTRDGTNGALGGRTCHIGQLGPGGADAEFGKRRSATVRGGEIGGEGDEACGGGAQAMQVHDGTDGGLGGHTYQIGQLGPGGAEAEFGKWWPPATGGGGNDGAGGGADERGTESHGHARVKAIRARGGGDAGPSGANANAAAHAPSPAHGSEVSLEYSTTPSYNPTPPEPHVVLHDEWFDSSNASEAPRELDIESVEAQEARAAEQRAYTERLLAEAARRLEAVELAEREAAEDEVERREEADEAEERWWAWCEPGTVAWARTAANGAGGGEPRGPWRRVVIQWVQDQRTRVRDAAASSRTGRDVWWWVGDVIVLVWPVGAQEPFHSQWDAGGFAVQGLVLYLQPRDSETPPAWTSPPGSPPTAPTPPPMQTVGALQVVVQIGGVAAAANPARAVPPPPPPPLPRVIAIEEAADPAAEVGWLAWMAERFNKLWHILHGNGSGKLAHPRNLRAALEAARQARVGRNPEQQQAARRERFEREARVGAPPLPTGRRTQWGGVVERVGDAERSLLTALARQDGALTQLQLAALQRMATAGSDAAARALACAEQGGNGRAAARAAAGSGGRETAADQNEQPAMAVAAAEAALNVSGSSAAEAETAADEAADGAREQEAMGDDATQTRATEGRQLTPATQPGARAALSEREEEVLHIFAANVCGINAVWRTKHGTQQLQEEEEAEVELGDGSDLLTRPCDTLEAVCDAMDTGYIVGVLTETRVGAKRFAVVEGQFRRRGYAVAGSWGVRGATTEEVAGVMIVYRVSQVEVLAREEVEPGRQLALRLQLQRDSSELWLLGMYMPAPDAAAERRAEIKMSWQLQRQWWERVGGAGIAAGDANAQPDAALPALGLQCL